MNRRALYLDRSPGEARGVVLLDGEPEHLFIERDGDDPRLQLGAKLAARVAAVEAAIGAAFLDLGAGAQAILPYSAEARPGVGNLLEVEIRSEPRQAKLAVARALGAADGPPRLLRPPASLPERLRAVAHDCEVAEGRLAREAADEAEAQALSPCFPLSGGGDVAIEPTRALTAVDIDLGARRGSEPKRVTRQANLAALPQIARLLRLKGLGGLVVIDLVGRGHDGNALMAAARLAFAPDNPGVAIGPVTRFGTIELTIPRRVRPIGEILCDEGGAPSARTVAHRLLRRMEDEAQAQPGVRVVGRCAPEVAEQGVQFLAVLAGRFGARFSLRPETGLRRDQLDVAGE